MKKTLRRSELTFIMIWLSLFIGFQFGWAATIPREVPCEVTSSAELVQHFACN